MAVKFNEYWNIIPSKMEDYVDFMKRYRIPVMNNLGINVVAMWSALIGASPQIISEGISEDLDQLEKALKSADFKKINTRLLTMVTDYRSKVLIPTGRFPDLPRSCDRGTVKFSQYWDIIPGHEDEYAEFITKEYHPEMESLCIRCAGEWSVLIGESPHIFYEGLCNEAEQLLVALKTTKFSLLKSKLLRLVFNYSSRVLVYHAYKDKDDKSKDYKFVVL